MRLYTRQLKIVMPEMQSIAHNDTKNRYSSTPYYQQYVALSSISQVNKVWGIFNLRGIDGYCC
jgi:hypothetical protein